MSSRSNRGRCSLSSQNRDNAESFTMVTVFESNQSGVSSAFIDDPPALMVLKVRGRTTQEPCIVSHGSHGEVAAVADHGSDATREVVVIDAESIPPVIGPRVAVN